MWKYLEKISATTDRFEVELEISTQKIKQA